MTEPYDPDNAGFFDPMEDFNATEFVEKPWGLELIDDPDSAFFDEDPEFSGFEEDDF